MSNPTGKHRPPRRHHGEGSVPIRRTDAHRQRPFQTSISLGTDPVTGKRLRQYFSSDTRLAAAELRDEALRARRRGLHPEVARMTVSDALDRYLSAVHPPAVKPSSYERYRDTVESTLRPSVGSIRLLELDAEDVAAAMAGWGAPSRRALGLRRLRAVLGLMVARRLIEHNPAQAVKMPRVQKREAPTLGPVEVARIIAAAQGHRLSSLIVTALGCGLRRGELLGLRWADVDLEAGTALVRHQLRRIPAEFRARPGVSTQIETPKEDKARLLPLPASVVEALTEHRTAQRAERAKAKRWAENDLVWADETGYALWPGSVTLQVQTILRRVVPGARLHDCRHAFSTLLASAGVHPRVQMGLLGHATIGQSMSYTSVIPADARHAADAVDALLRTGT